MTRGQRWRSLLEAKADRIPLAFSGVALLRAFPLCLILLTPASVRAEELVVGISAVFTDTPRGLGIELYPIIPILGEGL